MPYVIANHHIKIMGYDCTLLQFKKQCIIEKIISEFIWEDWVGETINLK